MLHGLKAQSRRLFDTIHLYYYEALLPPIVMKLNHSNVARGFEMIDLCRPPQAKMKFTVNKRSAQVNYRRKRACCFEIHISLIVPF